MEPSIRKYAYTQTYFNNNLQRVFSVIVLLGNPVLIKYILYNLLFIEVYFKIKRNKNLFIQIYSVPLLWIMF